MSRSGRMRLGLLGAMALLLPATAQAGDPTAHTSATVTAAWFVSLLPQFANGVGSPQYLIPTGNIGEAICLYDPSLSYDNGTCAFSDLNGLAINAPDAWSCLDPLQPPALSALNSSMSYSETLVATLAAGLGISSAAMACNWNHFVNNAGLGDRFSAAATAQLVQKWADEIPTSIQKQDGLWSCSVEAWVTYYQRIVNSLHYIQDAQTEHHLFGNQNCAAADVVPSQNFDQTFTFDGVRSCSVFLDTTSEQASSQSIACDQAIVNPGGLLGGLQPNMLALDLMCQGDLPLACMGFERVLRHHCNVPGVTKSIVCDGPPDDHLLSTNTFQYCEGEIYDTGGGQDFVGPAVFASIPILINAAERWATLCADPPGTGVPDPPANVGSASGDPHLRTFDGVRYDFQAYGECTLVKDASDGLEIQTRMHPWGASKTVAINVGVAARVGTDVVALYSGGRVTLNHVDATFDEGRNVLAGGGVLWRAGETYVLVWPDNAQLRLSIGGEYLSPQVYLPDGRRGRVVGPLGNLDGVAAGDLVTRQGMALGDGPVSFETFHGVYVESWRVGTTSLFDYPAGEDTENFTDRSFPPQLATTASLTDAERQMAMAACTAAGVSADWVDSCVLDVGSTGDRRFAADLAGLPPAAAAVTIAAPVLSGSGGSGGAGGVGGMAGGGGGGQGGARPRATITGLFPTGVDASGAGLPSGASDPHYQILDPSQSAIVINPGNGVWLANTTMYRWVWQTSGGSPTNVTRVFRTTFSLDGFVPATASLSGTWATDNIGTGIALNGQNLGVAMSGGFGAFTSFSVPAGAPFVPGVNTLDFTVVDQGVVAGFLVGSLSGTAQLAGP